MRGERALAFVSDQVWAIPPSKLEAIFSVIEANLVGPPISEETIRAYAAAMEQRPSPRSAGAVAVLPVHGLLVQRMNMMSAMSGGTSTQVLSRMFRDLMANENVMAVVLEFATQGGSVYGLEELANEIAASKGKPVIGMVNCECASGGLWLATQCDQVVCAPSSEIGALGCIACHTDLSKMAEMEGVKKTFIVSSGSPFKSEGNEWEPLAKDALAHLQGRVDSYANAFEKAVARGRGTTVQNVRENYGQGRMYGAQEALKRGMIDGILPIDEVVARLASGRKRVVGGNSAEGGSHTFAGPGVQIINAEDARAPVDETPPVEPVAAPSAEVTGKRKPLIISVESAGPAAGADDYEPIPPDADGNCPDGHEKGDDGMCHPVEEVKGEAKAETSTPATEPAKLDDPASKETVTTPKADDGDLDRRRRRLRLAEVSRR